MIYELLKNKYTVDKTHENLNSLKGIPWCVNKIMYSTDIRKINRLIKIQPLTNISKNTISRWCHSNKKIFSRR